MDTPFPIVGIDVSKATLAVCHQVEGQPRHLEVSNTPAGFAQLVQACGTDSLYVLEATGTYYLALAYYLHGRAAQVAVLNPLIIKRFIQMHLSKRQERPQGCAVADALRSAASYPALAARRSCFGGMLAVGASQRTVTEAKNHGP